MKNFIFDNWLLLGPVLYEIISRVWPTRWNISIFDNIWKIINLLIPNKRVSTGKEKQIYSDASGKNKNMVSVRTNRHILKIILILCLFNSDPLETTGQIWQNFKGIRSVNNSDTTKQLPVQGSIFFDDVDNIFYGHNGVGWKEFGKTINPGDFWKTSGTTNFLNNVNIAAQGFDLVFNLTGTSNLIFSDDFGATGIDINPALNLLESTISIGDFGINSTVNNLNLSGTSGLTLNTAGNTRFRITSTGLTQIGTTLFLNISETVNSNVISQSGGQNTLNIVGATGNAGQINGGNIHLVSGAPFIGGGGVAGNISLNASNGDGAGADGNIEIELGATSTGTITINEQAGFLVMPSLPTATPCATAPSGTIWNNAGVLNICP